MADPMAEGRVRFDLLGPLRVVDAAGTARPVRTAKQRIVLAALLLADGAVVPAANMSEALWDVAAPPNEPAVMRTYVMRLRRALGPVGCRVVSRSPGWALTLFGPEEFDLAEVEQLRIRAQAAGEAGEWRQVSALLTRALSHWRGEPLIDVPSVALARRDAQRLSELRLSLTEARIDADLRVGQHAEVIPELRRLATEHPLREHMSVQLMLACYRCGQQAAALKVYRDAYQALAEELGVAPGRELRECHRRILAADPALDLPARQLDRHVRPVTADGPPDAAIVPRQLPAAVSHFTGRAAQLDALTGMLAEASGTRTVVISALAGTAGVGKTATAVHWAHQVAERFPDGQLYVNLRGYDPDNPVAAADALAGFLRSLGVPGTEIPDETEGRAALYRSKLAGRRVLVLLDNARDSEQIRPLLPGDPGCAALITSRDALAGLVAADGALRLDLDVLPLADAVSLLRTLIGPRAEQNPGATAELARLCACLPLALRIAAELAAARPQPLEELADELATARLDTLDAGEGRVDLRTVFSLSVRQLPDDVGEAFALIGLHPGPDLDVHATAALTGTTIGHARRMLGRLHRNNMVQAVGAGRYGMHDLLRDYARELAAARDGRGWRQQALTQLFDYYLEAAATAMETLFPAEVRRLPSVATTAAALPAIAGEAGARLWLDAELANLTAVVAHCAGHGFSRHVTGIADTLFRYLIAGSHLPSAKTIYSHALQTARASGDLAAEAAALTGLGGIGKMKGQFRDAARQYQAALERYRQCEDRAGQARSLHNLGIAARELHDCQSSAGHYRAAIAAYEDTGDWLGAARAQVSLGAVEVELGCHDKASEHLQHALLAIREAQDQVFEAQALEGIGELSLQRGNLTEAAEHFGHALAIYRRLGHPAGTATQLSKLGEVSLRQAKHQQAISYLRQALVLFKKAGYRHGETMTLRSLAKAMNGVGQPVLARTELETALRLAAETGNTYQQAGVHRDLAESYQSAGEYEEAQRHWRQALDLYTHLCAPETDPAHRDSALPSAAAAAAPRALRYSGTCQENCRHLSASQRQRRAHGPRHRAP